jgi:hypothetical protein
MATLQSVHNPSGRIETGNLVLSAATSVARAPIAKPLKAFTSAHKAFSAADARVVKADEDVRKQQEVVGMRDAMQDLAVDTLARQLIAAGSPKANPFKPHGFEAPSTIQTMGYGAEAKVALRLAVVIKRAKGMSKGALAAAGLLEKTAKEVEVSLKELPKLLAARTAAIAARDGAGQAWETTFAALKLGAAYADSQGAKGLHDALFVKTAKPSKPRRSIAPPPRVIATATPTVTPQ